jgi:predicted Zn-dependent protease
VPEGAILIDRSLRLDPETYGAASGARMDLYTGWQAERDERRRQATVGHELGHLLGLGHVADTACLMASPAYAIEPCPAELEAVATR